MSGVDGWSELFWAAFKQSRNPMALLDVPRVVVEANGAFLKLAGYGRDDMIGRPAHRFVVGGALFSPREWAARLAVSRFTGDMELLCADGSGIGVEWGAHVEAVTGHRLVLLVVLSSSRWGAHFRRSAPSGTEPRELSGREREVVQLVAAGGTGP